MPETRAIVRLFAMTVVSGLGIWAAPAGAASVSAAGSDTVLPITVYLKPSNPAGLAAFVAAVQTPGNPAFHGFLSATAFVQRFAPSDGTVAAVVSALTKRGLTVQQLFANHLAIRVQGTVATINQIFQLDIHEATSGLRTGLYSTTQPTIPASLAGQVEGVAGFDTEDPSIPGPDPDKQVNTTGILDAFSTAHFSPALVAATGITDAPGHLTPADYEALYDIRPLTRAGNTGVGETIAIVSAGNFDKTIPAAFWSQLGINRTGSFVIENVDDSAGDPLLNDDEPYLDTEQAGAIAPASSLIDYVTAQGPSAFLDGFEAVASENKADIVSISLGIPELFFGRLPTKLYNATLLPVLRDVLSELAAQGETVFVSAGDGGAFQANRDVGGHYLVFPVVGRPAAFTPVISVNAIAASPLVTAAGGTTLPFTGTDTSVDPSVTVTIPAEQPWGESYLPEAALSQNKNSGEAESLLEVTFPKGGGGGVSMFWGLPSYQQRLAGTARTAAGQALFELTGGKPRLLYAPPAGLAGRNLPDLSANADPHTGYLVDGADGFEAGDGGTSFVAPQFAGTLALIDQALGHRVGQLNPLLYRLQAAGAVPARDITSGNNWAYFAHPGYDQASGLGAMDGYRLYVGLKSFD